VTRLAAAGVKRISFAGSLYGAGLAGFFDAAREIKSAGTFAYLDRMSPLMPNNNCLSRSAAA